MLESARAYALEKLAAARETDALARRHANHYAAYAERICDAFFAAGGTEDGFIAARATEFDNLRAALTWALGDDGDAGIALALLAHTSPLGLACGVARGVRSLADGSEAAPGEPGPVAATGRLVLRSGGSRGASWPRGIPVQVSTCTPPGRRRDRRCSRLANAGWPTVPAFGRCWTDGVVNVDSARAVLDEVRQLGQPDWPAWLPALRLSNAIRVSRMAGEFAVEVGELPATLGKLQREGDSAGRAAFKIGIHLAEESLLRGLFEEATQRLLALAQQGRQQRRDVVTMTSLFRSLISGVD